MSLAAYKKKRSFSKTPEPKGKIKEAASKQLLFVVQKHHASNLHYDFRLELRGVLKSWAVPKGPSMNPADKRLAMHVEDHPYSYKDFEGIIPEGNYGAGTVIVWDTGTYEPAADAGTTEMKEKELMKDYHKGSMSIILKGKKLKGEFALVKASGRGENSWLLIKKKDAFATDADILQKNKSVLSGKTLEQVAASKKSKQWISNRDDKGKLKEKGQGTIGKGQKAIGNRQSARGKRQRANEAVNTNESKLTIKEILKNYKLKKKAGFPKNLLPMLATLAENVEGEGWSYEIKWDGYRALAYLDNGNAELRSRNNKSFNDQFYPVWNAVKDWKMRAVVDGEIVAVNEEGISSFQRLQNWRSEADGELRYYVFDILWLEGYDLTKLSLKERRDIIRQLIPGDPLIQFSESFETSVSDFLDAAKKLGMEGIIAKKIDSEYFPGTRTKNWLKIKTGKRHEAIICGYTQNEDSTKFFSALILGVYKKNKLKFIGQVGTGFTTSLQREILQKLKPLETSVCPFPEIPIINKPTRFRPRSPKAAVTWVKPKLICEVQYQELTTEGVMRHPSFQGLRTDKTAKDVVLEKPVILPDEKKKKSPVEKKINPVPTKGLRKTLVNPHEKSQVKTINGQELKFSNLDKLYWPKEKISKGDMLNYYYQVAPYILPYMKDRPQSLNRYPDGITGESFYQKNVAEKIPSWLKTHNYRNTTKEGAKKFLVCTNEASLLYMANLGCIEMNPWHSRVDSPGRPDWSVIDLDPDTNPFSQVIEAANVIKKILDAAGVPAWPKTSGSTGIHIYIPLGAKYDYEQSKVLAELIVSLAQREIPGFTSLERNPSKRKGKIYLDFLQNRTIQTIASPYSLRPKPGATVSAPLHWEEIKPGLQMNDFTIFNMSERIKAEGDIFKGVLGKGIDLEKVLKKIDSVFG